MDHDPTINALHYAANEVKHLTADQLEDVMTVAMKTSLRDHALLLTIFHHALRASEGAALKLTLTRASELAFGDSRGRADARNIETLTNPQPATADADSAVPV